MYSLFAEQIAPDDVDDYLCHSDVEKYVAREYFPSSASYNSTPEEYLTLLTRAKAGSSIPIIGSLNGVSRGGWIRYARAMEEAGADALEINLFYMPGDALVSARAVEDAHVSVVRAIKDSIDIPVAMKLSPYFSSLSNLAARLERAGADGLVMFNRFYQPDFDPDKLAPSELVSLSTSQEMRLPLHWTALLYGRTSMDIAITTGVHNQFDVIKGLMAGANVTMIASELLRNGVGRIGEILEGLRNWMGDHDIDSIASMRGRMSYEDVPVPAAHERASYLRTLQSWRPQSDGNAH